VSESVIVSCLSWGNRMVLFSAELAKAAKNNFGECSRPRRGRSEARDPGHNQTTARSNGDHRGEA
jgi:hypothetical protein